jgi:hypothetical protein
MFIMHPREADRPRVDHDFDLILQEWALLPSNSVPNTANMEFNWLTINGVTSPMATPLMVRREGACVFAWSTWGWITIRFHLHGLQFADPAPLGRPPTGIDLGNRKHRPRRSGPGVRHRV